MILALDISSLKIGLALLNQESKKLECLDLIEFNKLDSLFQKLQYAEEYLKRYFYHNKIDYVVVENSLSKFMGGASTAKTIITLSNFNFVIQYYVYKEYKIECNTLYPISWKAKCGLNNYKKSLLNNGKDMDSKEISINFASILLKDTEYYDVINKKRILSRGKNKGKEVFVEGTDDMADAYLISVAFLKDLKEN